MSKYYTLEEVRAIRDKISKLGEGNFDELREELSKARVEWHEELQRYRIKHFLDINKAREVKDE
ncbi:MAG: hypothetical protein DDT23_01287 [candidate division WS2 bacterium]|nr:hypothetical protein [Candidatus Lithacetigena glycinireducens]